MLLCTCVLFGCASPDRSVVLHANTFSERLDGAPPNLALGPSAETNLLAEELTVRSSWPSLPTGYVLDDVTEATEVMFDDQSFYDRLGGSFFRAGQSVRTRVFLR